MLHGVAFMRAECPMSAGLRERGLFDMGDAIGGNVISLPGQSFHALRQRIGELDRAASPQVGLRLEREARGGEGTALLPDQPSAWTLRSAAGNPALAAAPAKRKIYVLHSGMNDPENCAAYGFRKGLIARGIPARDIIVLDTPYPSFSEGISAVQKNWNIYRDSTEPGSKISRDAYAGFERKLKASGVSSQDEIVWVGHSAGGQMGMTLSKMARDRGTFRFDTLITVGSPIGNNVTPKDVKVRSYISSADKVLMAANQVTMDNVFVEATASNLDGNDKVRSFQGVDHSQWYKDDKVLDRIVSETHPHGEPRKWSSWMMRSIAYLSDKLFGVTLEP